MGRAKAYRVCSFCNKVVKFVLHSDAKSVGISQRRIALAVIRALIRDQPQVYLFMGLTEGQCSMQQRRQKMKNGLRSVPS